MRAKYPPSEYPSSPTGRPDSTAAPNDTADGLQPQPVPLDLLPDRIQRPPRRPAFGCPVEIPWKANPEPTGGDREREVRVSPVAGDPVRAVPAVEQEHGQGHRDPAAG